MGMSGPQMVLTGTVAAGYIQWSYGSAAQLQDHMETQVYGYPLRMEEEVKELHKLAELQKSKDEFMASRQAEEGKAAMKSRCVSSEAYLTCLLPVFASPPTCLRGGTTNDSRVPYCCT